jgi:hypothetical protein
MKPEILCVHQVGKVGSTSVTAALSAMFPERTVYQTHTLSEIPLLNHLDFWLGHPAAPRINLGHHLRGSFELGKHLAEGVESVNWYLLSLVRDPLSRTISAFFQNLHKQWIYQIPPESAEICRRVLRRKTAADPGVAPGEMDRLVKDLIATFRARYPHRLFDHWFDREIKSIFGIDVFAEPFAIEQGYQIYQRGSVRLLMLRLEDAARTFDPAIKGWLSGSSLSARVQENTLNQSRANDGSTKGYSDLYRSFLKEFCIAPEKLAEYYQSRTARHFYSEEEAAEFRARWRIEAETGA